MRRFVHIAWYREHRPLIGYLILAAAVTFAIGGVLSNLRDQKDTQQRILHQACLSAKDTRAPLLHYLETTLALTDKAREAHLLPPAPPALRKLQEQSLQNLRTLTRVFQEKQAQPCPPAP